MHKKLLAISIAAGFALTHAQANDLNLDIIKTDTTQFIKDKYIVIFKTPSVLNINLPDAISDFNQHMANNIANQYGVNVINHYASAVNGVLIETNAEVIKKLNKDPNIKYIEQDQKITITPKSDKDIDQANATWGLDRIDQRNLPLNNTYNHDYNGTDVTAYVIDTGVLNSHNEFSGRAKSGYNFVDNNNDASDCNGHGTHVAGTIGGNTYGVAKNVDIVGVKVLDCQGSGSFSGVISGIDWVKDNASGPSVANMSLGGGQSQAIDDAVNAAVEAGITFVVAAGNDNSNACNYSPARAANAITVGSTDKYDSRSSFSNYGNCLDIYAPGSSITSSWISSNSSINTISGTSMAAPHVAGVAALYLDEVPSLSPDELNSKLINSSTMGKVTDAKAGSPNSLLYAYIEDDGGCSDNCPVEDQKLINNETSIESGNKGEQNYFYIDVPENTSELTISLSGGSGDADLYTNFNSRPTFDNYSCRPYKSGNNESCKIQNPTAGKWFVMLNAYTTFNNAKLTASFSNDNSSCETENCLENNVPEEGLSGSKNSTLIYSIVVPENSQLTIESFGGSGDADLYVKAGSIPSLSSYDCRPYKSGNNELCNFNVTTKTTYYIMLNGYTSYNGLTLLAKY